MTLKGKAENYRHCDNTWTFVMHDCDIKIEDKQLKSSHCKIVAFDTSLSGDPVVPHKPPPKPERKKADGSKAAKRRKKEDKKHPDAVKKEEKKDKS